MNGLIVINEDESDAFDANGDIFIGNPDAFCQGEPCELEPVEYDGVIHILNGSSGGGDLAGEITVLGCHDDSNAFELCVCGSVTGNTTVDMTDCQNQVDPPYFTCSDSPCN